MSGISCESIMIAAAALFAVGVLGVMLRRNIFFVLLSIELMLSAAGLAFIGAGAKWQEPDGQVIFLFVLAIAAAEISVGLGFVIQFARYKEGVDIDMADSLKGQ